jgi:hypothetical protein
MGHLAGACRRHRQAAFARPQPGTAHRRDGGDARPREIFLSISGLPLSCKILSKSQNMSHAVTIGFAS